MSMRIITGSTGSTHVTSNDDGEFNQGIYGSGLVVLPNGNKLAAQIIDNNTVRIKDGDLVFQGRHALINPGTTEDKTIDTGAIGYNRYDLICVRYEVNGTTGYESMTLVVKKGTQATGTPSDPSYTTGNIRTGSTVVEIPLYRVKLTGATITAVEAMFTDQTESIMGRVDTISNNLKDNSKSFKFGYDTVTGRYGYYKDGADTVTPFRGPFTIPSISLAGGGYVPGTVTNQMQINVADYDKVKIQSISCSHGNYAIYGDNTLLTYTANTEINISAYSILKIVWMYTSTPEVQTVECTITNITLS